MKILTNEQMLAADQQTIQEQGITSWASLLGSRKTYLMITLTISMQE